MVRVLGSCRAVLGVEAGVSIFDLDDQVGPATDAFLASHPSATFEDVEREVLAPWEDNVFYRTISPRHFEAAAFNTCQILFEGSYSGLMEPGTHYIGLRKDFGNLAEVIATFRDRAQRERIVANARRDLIDSGRHTYEAFVGQFDDELARAGIAPPTGARPRDVDRALNRGATLRRTERRLRTAYWRLRLAAAAPPRAADDGTSPGIRRSSAAATTPGAPDTNSRWRPARNRTDAPAAIRGLAQPAPVEPPHSAGRARCLSTCSTSDAGPLGELAGCARASSRFSSSNPLPML